MDSRSIAWRRLERLALVPTLALASCLVTDNPKFTGGASLDSDSDSSADGDGDPNTGDGDPNTGDGDPNTGDGDPGDWDCEDGDPDGEAPSKPGWLTEYTLGEPADVEVTTLGPGLVLVGGDKTVDAAFTWQADRIAMGDVVVLVTENDDSYNEYLSEQIGDADSVQTLVLDSFAAADDPYTNWVVRHAEAIVVVAGSTPTTAVQSWAGTQLQESLRVAWCKGAIIAGASAGVTLLGKYVFYAAEGDIDSSAALENPYAPAVTLTDSLWSIPLLSRVVIDHELPGEDRMGRMLTFMALAIDRDWTDSVIGLGLGTNSAMVIDANGNAEVFGSERTYLVHLDEPPTKCAPNEALELGPLDLFRLDPGSNASWPGGVTQAASIEVSAGGGQIMPADPY